MISASTRPRHVMKAARRRKDALTCCNMRTQHGQHEASTHGQSLCRAHRHNSHPEARSVSHGQRALIDQRQVCMTMSKMQTHNFIGLAGLTFFTTSGLDCTCPKLRRSVLLVSAFSVLDQIFCEALHEVRCVIGTSADR